MSLADELLKAGLLDKKKVKQLKHEKRLEDKAKIEPLSQQAGYLKAQQEKREQEKLLVQEERRKREEKERQERLKNLVLSNKISSSGNIRHYFVTRDQHISFLEISTEMSSHLAKGSYAIVEVMDTNEYVIVPISIAKKIEETAPEFVRFPKI